MKDVFVCESIIDALTCWVYGKYAVALMGLGTQEQVKLLNKLQAKRIILALDADSVGIYASTKLKYKLKNSGKIVEELFIPIGKDINNLSEKEFHNLYYI